MVARRKSASPTLFSAAGLEQDAPRPLADKLRPASFRRSSARITCSAPTAR